MSEEKKLLDVDHVTVSFRVGGVVSSAQMIAVNNVSFSLADDKPEIYAIAGESGSGKTTLANVLAARSGANIRQSDCLTAAI